MRRSHLGMRPAPGRLRSLAVAALCLCAVCAIAGELTTERLTVLDRAEFYGRLTLSPPPDAPAEGLVLHYTFDVDEGGTVTDQSGNGHEGTVHDALWTSGGKRGGGGGHPTHADLHQLIAMRHPDRARREAGRLECEGRDSTAVPVFPPCHENIRAMDLRPASTGSQHRPKRLALDSVCSHRLFGDGRVDKFCRQLGFRQPLRIPNDRLPLPLAG